MAASPPPPISPVPPELPVTADRPAIQPVRKRRPFGVRLWLGLMFSAIGILTGATVYIVVSGSSESAAESRTSDLAVGRTLRVRENVEAQLPPTHMTKANAPVDVLRETRPTEDFRTWLYNNPAAAGNPPKLVSPETVAGLSINTIRGRAEAVSTALDGDLYVSSDLPNDRTMVAVQLVGGEGRPGRPAVDLRAAGGGPLGSAGAGRPAPHRPDRLGARRRTDRVPGREPDHLAGSSAWRPRPVSSPRATSTRRCTRAAATRSATSAGRSTRCASPSRETFDALSSERDRLSAIFTSLDEAVIVVDPDGDVRFANPASAGLIGEDGMVVDALRPWIRRATHRGSAESDHVAIGERVFAIGARYLPAERSALLVVRDRTEELRRDQAEREFVSNAAHELRNPIAGMSGAIEVLRSGAKDDPEARDHFLDRLATDVDRVSRLTRALLTLARMEAIGEGEADVVSVDIAISEAIAALDPYARASTSRPRSPRTRRRTPIRCCSGRS